MDRVGGFVLGRIVELGEEGPTVEPLQGGQHLTVGYDQVPASALLEAHMQVRNPVYL